MERDTESKKKIFELRRLAEAVVVKELGDVSEISNLTPEDVQRLIHDLRVHQIELEMQNEELRQAQPALEESGVGAERLFGTLDSRPFQARSWTLFCCELRRHIQDLAESELFGHERGSFTGAHGGILELAEGGTLLLNGIGEFTLSLQSKLLTFLDTRSFLRLGGQKSITVNARIISATMRSLDTEAAEGRFLSPLLYRLDVFAMHVPPPGEN